MKNLITRLITLFLPKRFVSLHLLGRALILKKRKKLRGTRSIQARKILFVERKASFYLRSREFYAFFFFFFFRRTRKVGQHEEKRISTPLLPIKRVPRPAPIPVYVCMCVRACYRGGTGGKTLSSVPRGRALYVSHSSRHA